MAAVTALFMPLIFSFPRAVGSSNLKLPKHAQNMAASARYIVPHCNPVELPVCQRLRVGPRVVNLNAVTARTDSERAKAALDVT